MGFSFDISVPVLTVFLQGLVSFFSPCVLPLLPLYIGYLSGGTGKRGEDGRIHYERKKVMIHTLCFVIGVSFAFFLLGFGFSAMGNFFKSNQLMFARVGGILVVLLDCTSWAFSAHPRYWARNGGFRLNWMPWPCRHSRRCSWDLPSALHGPHVWARPWPACC